MKLLGRKDKEHVTEAATPSVVTMREVDRLYAVCRALRMRIDELDHRLDLAERKLRSEASYASKAKHNGDLPERNPRLFELGRRVK